MKQSSDGKVTGAALVLIAGLLLTTLSCSEKTGPNPELATLERTFAPAEKGSAPQAEAAPYVSAAVSAVRANDLAGGIVALQAVEQSRGLSAQELRVVHDAMQSVTAKLVEKAAKGDAGAKAQLSTIERTRSQ